MLSHYHPSLAGTPGDTPVYVFEGAEPGGTLVVVGGTHENEIAGVFAATVLVETARVHRGRLIVVPRANNSAVTVPDDKRPAPDWITIASSSGARRFRFGSRLTNPLHQGAPDPAEVMPPGASKVLPGYEARNLDRAYPGSAAGPLTQRVAFAIVELLRREKADLAFDLHEAPPASRLSWMLVSHPRGLDLAAMAVLELDAAGLAMKLEVSDEGFRGLSHREWGDATTALSFLVETPNPNQVEGARDFEPVGHAEYPLALRVAAQIQTVLTVAATHSASAPPERRIELAPEPDYRLLGTKGLSEFLLW
jgi:predicted deacylase